MTREELDSTTFNAEIGASGSETIEIDSSRAHRLIVQVDNGTTGGTPETYDMNIDTYHTEYDDYMRQEEVTDGGFYNSFDANGSKMQVTITDTSSSAATRRILVKTYRDMD